jgi:hypothetical protein
MINIPSNEGYTMTWLYENKEVILYYDFGRILIVMS